MQSLIHQALLLGDLAATDTIGAPTRLPSPGQSFPIYHDELAALALPLAE